MNQRLERRNLTEGDLSLVSLEVLSLLNSIASPFPPLQELSEEVDSFP